MISKLQKIARSLLSLIQADFLFDKRESSFIAWLDVVFKSSGAAVTTNVNSVSEKDTKEYLTTPSLRSPSGSATFPFTTTLEMSKTASVMAQVMKRTSRAINLPISERNLKSYVWFRIPNMRTWTNSEANVRTMNFKVVNNRTCVPTQM